MAAQTQLQVAAGPRKPPAWVNTIIKGLLRSPLHGPLSKQMMLVTFTGRKTGKVFTTPVTYMREGEDILFFTSNPWWKNLEGGAKVTLCVEGREIQGATYPTQDTEQIYQAANTFLKRVGIKNARMIGLNDLDTSREPTREELLAHLQGQVLIRVKVN
jgi:hypothetical protein